MAGDVEELIIGGPPEGGPPVRRRSLAALLGGAALVCAVGLTATIALNDADPTVGPTSSSTSLQPGPDNDDPTRASTMNKKQAQILALVRAKLPGDVQPQAQHGVGEASVVAMAISDRQGYTWVLARIGTVGGDGWDPCRAVRSCSVKQLKGGGTLYTLDEVETGGNSTHYSASYTYERPDGRYVYFNQSNVFDANGRRSSLPLTDKQVARIVTAPEWGTVVADCRPDVGPNC
jgi:hypothetical protein